MINTAISSVLQVLVFSIIPIFVFLIKDKTLVGFNRYIGLVRSNTKANLWAIVLMIIMASPLLTLAAIDEEILQTLHDPKSVTGSIRSMGFGIDALVTIFFVAIIKTGLSEEIFFRGFLAKRLIAISNFVVGNTIHAIIFGAIHTLLFLSITDNVFFLVIIFVIPSIGAYCKVYLNEKVASGSIIPGWIAHGAGNLIAYGVIAFML